MEKRRKDRRTLGRDVHDQDDLLVLELGKGEVRPIGVLDGKVVQATGTVDCGWAG